MVDQFFFSTVWKFTNFTTSRFYVKSILPNESFYPEQFQFLVSVKLISRKMFVADELLNFHTLVSDKLIFLEFFRQNKTIFEENVIPR